MKETLVKLMAGPVSGEELAAQLGITRSAVHKRIESLRAAGVEIDALAGKGYSLRAPNWPNCMSCSKPIRRNRVRWPPQRRRTAARFGWPSARRRGRGVVDAVGLRPWRRMCT